MKADRLGIKSRREINKSNAIRMMLLNKTPGGDRNTLCGNMHEKRWREHFPIREWVLWAEDIERQAFLVQLGPQLNTKIILKSTDSEGFTP